MSDTGLETGMTPEEIEEKILAMLETLPAQIKGRGYHAADIVSGAIILSRKLAEEKTQQLEKPILVAAFNAAALLVGQNAGYAADEYLRLMYSFFKLVPQEVKNIIGIDVKGRIVMVSDMDVRGSFAYAIQERGARDVTFIYEGFEGNAQAFKWDSLKRNLFNLRQVGEFWGFCNYAENTIYAELHSEHAPTESLGEEAWQRVQAIRICRAQQKPGR